MSIQHEMKNIALRFGIQIKRYNPSESLEARLFRQMEAHNIDMIIDVGANDGGYGRMLRNGGYLGQILSFEPLSDTHKKLQQAAADDSNWHIAERQAIGSHDGEIKINLAGNTTSSSILPMNSAHVEAAPHSKYIGSELVPIRRLDSIEHKCIENSKAILLKIDTQGYEIEVLRGAENTLKRVVGAQIELSLTPLYTGQALYRNIIDHMSAHGFSLWGVLPGFTDPVSGRMLQMDGVFYKD